MASKLKLNNGVILKSALGLITVGISAMILWLCGRAFAHEARIVGVEKDTTHVQATVGEIKADLRDLCKEQRAGFKELADKLEALKP